MRIINRYPKNFKEYLNTLSGDSPRPHAFFFLPKRTEKENEDFAEFCLELPDVSPERISVRISLGHVEIRVSANDEIPAYANPLDKSGLYRFKLPKTADTNSIKAELKLGILKIVVPKNANVSYRTVPIEVI